MRALWTTPRLAPRLAALALVGPLIALCSDGLVQGLPFVLPVLLLLGLLAVRRYPGERALSRLRARGLERPRRAAPTDPSPRRVDTPRAFVPRGGRLIASSLAVRPPPALSFAPLS